MKRRFRYIGLFILCAYCSVYLSYAQNTYRTEILANMAESLNISSVLDTLKEGEFKNEFVYKQKPLRVIQNNKSITHIGYILFSDQQRKVMPIAVCNFLERYILALDLPMQRLKTINVQLAEDEISFLTGNLKSIFNAVGDTLMDISLENVNDRSYRLSWTKKNKPYCSVSFPIDYSLLHGTSMEEIELLLADDLRNVTIHKPDMLNRVELNQLQLGDKGIYVLPGYSYQVEELNSDRYYKKSLKGQYSMVFDMKYPEETLANLMTTLELENNFQVNVKLKRYPFEEEVITISLINLIGYFLQKGCTPYFGVIGIENNVAKCLLVMHNPVEGYSHNLDVLADLKQLKYKKGNLGSITMHCYIPTSKVKNLIAD